MAKQSKMIKAAMEGKMDMKKDKMMGIKEGGKKDMKMDMGKAKAPNKGKGGKGKSGKKC